MRAGGRDVRNEETAMLLSAEEVCVFLERRLAGAGKLGLKVGVIATIGEGVFRATVVNASEQTVVDVEVDRATGHILQVI